VNLSELDMATTMTRFADFKRALKQPRGIHVKPLSNTTFHSLFGSSVGHTTWRWHAIVAKAGKPVMNRGQYSGRICPRHSHR
ncbi:UNVERIFIED_CONTAM: hypothetical protein NY603_37475, partial [Bacteroidetes bacterium 56_B9]